MSFLSSLSNEEFIRYLEQLERDFRKSGHPATADDYAEMRRRLENEDQKHNIF